MINIFRLCLVLISVTVLSSCTQLSKELSGVVVYGHEARTVQLCGDSKLFWLHTTPEQHIFLESKIQRLTQKPYQELYLNFTGSMMADSPGEFAREYDGSIRLEEVRHLSGLIPESCRNNRLQTVWEHAKMNGVDFRATGNEPGWLLEISEQTKLVLVTGYGTERHEFDLPEPVVDAASGTTQYEVVQSGEKLKLMISDEPCQDTMSGEAFESRVEVLIDGVLLRGCGRALH